MKLFLVFKYRGWLFHNERGQAEMGTIVYCGLVCFFCSESKDCKGCRNGGCESHSRRKNYNCCTEKRLDGCREFSEFPCTGCILDKFRIRSFAEFARWYGSDELEKCLFRNKESGIAYHFEVQLVGDYDNCETEEEIIKMIKSGKWYDLLVIPM